MADAPSGNDHWAGESQGPTQFVIIVDDEPAALAMLERLVSSWGYRTLAIGSFEEARIALGRSKSV